MKKNIIYISTALFLALLISGCVNNAIIRSDIDSNANISESYQNTENKKASAEYYDHNDRKYSLSFVEIDDQGIFYSHRQLERTLKVIDDIKEGQDIIVFVHGWMHNSSFDDTNVIDVRRYLSKIAPPGSKRRTTGVYVGWRGDNFHIPYLPMVGELPTFYNRKDTSIEIGNGEILELFIKLEKIRNIHKDTRLFIIGHSFGGSIVLTALNKVIYSRAILEKEGLYKGFGDAVILINPAIEATSFFPLRELSDRLRSGSEFRQNKDPLPRIIIATSTGDTATKKAFFFARAISTPLTESHILVERPENTNIQYNESSMDIFAVGHYEPFKTHRLIAGGSMRNIPCAPSASKNWRKDMYESFSQNVDYTFPSSKLKITHLNRSSIYDPFWVIETNDDVLVGHSGIFNRNIGCFISELYFPEAVPKTDSQATEE